MPEPTPLDEVRRDVRLVAQRIFVADDRREAVDEGGVECSLKFRSCGKTMVVGSALSRGAAARESRSLIASPKSVEGNRLDRDGARATAIELLHIGEKIARRFAQIA